MLRVDETRPRFLLWIAPLAAAAPARSFHDWAVDHAGDFATLSSSMTRDASHRVTEDAEQYDGLAVSVTSALGLPRSSLMRTLKPLVLVVGTVLTLGGCAPASPPAVDTGADEAALKAATRTWLEAYNAGDVEKIVALYAEDAVLMPPHAPVANGHAAIRAFLSGDTAGAKAAGIKLVPGTSTAGVAGDTGWESGTYTATNAAGTTVDSGSYLSVSHKSNGKWLYYRDTYNSDRPLPAAAPAEKK